MEKEPDESGSVGEFHSVYRQRIIAILNKPGTELDDICVLQLFYLMCRAKRYRNTQVRLVDSCVLEAALRCARPSRLDKQINDLRSVFEELPVVPLVLIPLVGSSHWSLLVYRTRRQRWYHLDSLAPYHSRMAHHTLQKMYNLMIVPRSLKSLLSVKLPHQRSGWECGLYVLQYMLMSIESSNAAGLSDETKFYTYLKEHGDIACDKNLLLCTENLLALLRK